MQTGLLVGSGDASRLAAAVGGETGAHVKLETLSKVILGLELGADEVRGCPGLRQDEAVGLVGVLGLDVAIDELGLLVVPARDFEGNVRWRGSLDLKADGAEGVVLCQQVVGGLSKILYAVRERVSVVFGLVHTASDGLRTFQDGGTGWGRDMTAVVCDVEEKDRGEV